ncbi:hypothetical protein Bca52824_045076 [Brassica carinata]|uniref:Uncharacterized protein n=1 Tax=Brassica carinata TaxID=52824 RepID=A0A8X7RCD5_BRACI|nr:hypothetical protein Bca52824_045076 [Brassica carinata]
MRSTCKKWNTSCKNWILFGKAAKKQFLMMDSRRISLMNFDLSKDNGDPSIRQARGAESLFRANEVDRTQKQFPEFRQFMMGNGKLVRTLIHTDVTKYLSFKAVDGSYVFVKGKVQNVPGNLVPNAWQSSVELLYDFVLNLVGEVVGFCELFQPLLTSTVINGAREVRTYHATHAAGVLPAREERKKSDKVEFTRSALFTCFPSPTRQAATGHNAPQSGSISVYSIHIPDLFCHSFL